MKKCQNGFYIFGMSNFYKISNFFNFFFFFLLKDLYTWWTKRCDIPHLFLVGISY